MFFASDNWAGAHPSINERLSKESTRFAAAYGTSKLDKAIETRFNEVFEREVAVFFVATGTAANSLSLASIARPGGLTFCHTEAHVIEDECGAPDFFSGMRMVGVDGPEGKMLPDNLVERIGRYPQDAIHHGRAAAVTMTQATEVGTIYSLDEIDTISKIAKKNGLPLHMDGARFANALVSLGCSPAEMTWKRGVDVLSFGGTKNGCWCAEAIVFFDPDLAKDFAFLRKRTAQLFSKSRFIAAQFEAYLQDDLWLDLARHANAMADRMRAGIEHTDSAKLAWSTTSNEIFAVVKKTAIDNARDKGAQFYDWPISDSAKHLVGPDEGLIRLVTSFATSDADVADFLACLG
ncbi:MULTISPECIES: threonine aldolase family protein [unclassified Rhizobium]|uniref:threonine aldolase family protein n=1 Tax=unclassified Rhizobium TaxID=2613769 RepID=UPI001ADC0108|nr:MULTISPECIES: low specificity L-threonine aldolase [unclassified Rhizobium]MBO9099732.1 low specificity L-threonine aldolase [Rhizobium sp. L58/93]MBO9131737.1 low specificity L-threonine aldolase [Rhizobium sp. B209b/85]MBO9169721.1 low specificity L-threonine aldolase [Rhizobium sp. L245/93]MBO9185679.1 low specificity L-threonine aldolase [Rhizobium sp. E27B/91]QXZ82444.1 low specificity L-threonine aldolase [Rhizobium sp. K1/93]